MFASKPLCWAPGELPVVRSNGSRPHVPRGQQSISVKQTHKAEHSVERWAEGSNGSQGRDMSKQGQSATNPKPPFNHSPLGERGFNSKKMSSWTIGDKQSRSEKPSPKTTAMKKKTGVSISNTSVVGPKKKRAALDH